ncbi:hypothetical protein P9112_002246 [Eukaryota sp. TZLM1-RC]
MDDLNVEQLRPSFLYLAAATSGSPPVLSKYPLICTCCSSLPSQLFVCVFCSFRGCIKACSRHSDTHHCSLFVHYSCKYFYFPSFHSITPVSSFPHIQEYTEGVLDSYFSSTASVLSIPRGVANLGSSCYMGSVLQSLSMIPSFVSFFLSEQHVGCILPNCVACEFDRFLQAKFYPSANLSAPVLPSSMLFKVWCTIPSFAGHAQQDSHEFFLEFLNVLHENLSDGNTPCDCVVHRLFGGELTSLVSCSMCDHEVSRQVEPFLELSLPILDTIDLCFEHFTNSEALDLKNSDFNCINCQEDAKFRKSIILSSLPEILVIQLNRFTVTSNGSVVKNFTKVDIPQQVNLNRQSYCLSSLICHRGNELHTGHYLSYLRREGFWFMADDDCVSVVDFDQAVKDTPYLLFLIKDKVNYYL